MAENEENNLQKPAKTSKQHNVLPIWGNEQTMNLNPLILANIQGSSYFKVHLFKLKTYHEVVDEIYYQVKHLEPWERGSRKTAGQTGMCGGVRGVGAGGIVSTAFCLLYKLYTLRLTRKQVNGLLQHTDSPYIRALGFMYIRYTQPPADLFDWYVDYLDDEEEIDPRAGGGGPTTIGALVRQMLIKLDWFSTLFPRIPVPIQKQIEQKLGEHNRQLSATKPAATYRGGSGGGAGYSSSRMEADRREHDDRDRRDYSDIDRYSKDRPVKRDDRDKDRDRDRGREREREKDRRERDRERDRVIRAVVFRDTHAHSAHHIKEEVLPYPSITDGMTVGVPPNAYGSVSCGNGREGGVSPNAAAAAAVAAVAHGLRRQMCNMVVAAQRPPDHPQR